MDTSNENKSIKIIERIEQIKKEIKFHNKNIKLLSNYAYKHFNTKKNCYAPQIANYNRIPKSGDRYRWTLKNITEQVMLLENEMAVLVKYGT